MINWFVVLIHSRKGSGQTVQTDISLLQWEQSAIKRLKCLLLMIPFVSFWFGLMLNVPVNNFSVMLGQSHHFLGITSTFGGKICLPQGNNTATRVGLEPPTSGSGVRGVTTRPPRPSLLYHFKLSYHCITSS